MGAAATSTAAYPKGNANPIPLNSIGRLQTVVKLHVWKPHREEGRMLYKQPACVFVFLTKNFQMSNSFLCFNVSF